jgi:hypothetical protein
VAQGCEKIAQSWNIQFKFAAPRTRMMAVCLAVALYSPVHSNWLLGPRPGKAIKKSSSSWELYECCALAVEEITWHLWFLSDYQILHCNVERCQRFATCVLDKIFSDRTIPFQLFQRDSILKMQSFIHYQFSSPKFGDLIRYSWYATQYVMCKLKRLQHQHNSVCAEQTKLAN